MARGSSRPSTAATAAAAVESSSWRRDRPVRSLNTERLLHGGLCALGWRSGAGTVGPRARRRGGPLGEAPRIEFENPLTPYQPGASLRRGGRPMHATLRLLAAPASLTVL